jgi:hypothetical protein
MRKVVLAALVAVCAVLVVVPAGLGAKGGNSENAKLCQQGGYEDWVRADQTPFANVGECVSYAAQGGTLTAPTPALDRAYCAPAGLPLVPGPCVLFGTNLIDFDASSGPLGESPTGTFRVEIGSLYYEVQFTCLQVTGNVASLGGSITESNLGFLGQPIAFTVLDAPGQDLISDGTQLATVPLANTPNCGDVTLPTTPITGDIVVEDN